jgi:DNA-binding NtrC family response regulator
MEIPESRIDDSGMALLQGYDWPGNVRELQNVIQRLLISSDDLPSRADIEAALGSPETAADDLLSDEMNWTFKTIQPLREMEKVFRKSYFLYIRSQAKTDAEAARLLGLAPSNYHRMCKEMGLK